MKFSFYKSLVLILLSVFTFFSDCAEAQIYSYTNATSGTPAAVAANASGSNLVRVNGATIPGSPCATGFSSTNFTAGTVYNTSLKAIEFTVTPNTGFQLNIFSLSAGLRRSSTGPALTRFAYSTDEGITWIDEGTNHAPKNSGCGSINSYTWNMNPFVVTTAIKVRIYGFSASATAGTLQLLNVTLGGTVTGSSTADDDGDGFSSGLDCNDADPSIYPGATEVCNGVDDNCDGQSDEGVLLTFYADADNDGFGDETVSAIACTAPSGYVSTNSDCDDASASVNPGVPDVCNTIDDNCNGQVDENAITATISPEGTITACKNVKVTLTANTDAGITYTWYRNNAVIAGETQSIYKTKKAGKFKVTETNGFGCSSTSAVTKIERIVCLEKEVHDIAIPAELMVFPNPSHGTFTVQLKLTENEQDQATVEVMNIMGQKIYSQQVSLIDGTLKHDIRLQLNDGLYLVRVELGGREFIETIVCQQ